jgi:acyl-CoA dehydrogenase
MWDFSTEPEFQEKLDWIERFMEEEVYPLETIALDLSPEQLERVTVPLKQKVKDAGLWACHLTPELGGQGWGQVKLALMNEIIGRSNVLAPPLFGSQAPDSGNAEILALFGTDEQKRRWLEPLLAGRIRSCYSMTEPGAGSDPLLLRTRAVRDGDEWVINGHKWFSSNASRADFLIAMCVTDPEGPPFRRQSLFIVPRGTPGLNIVREVGILVGEAHHAEILYQDVRVPAENLLGPLHGAFVIAQKRLGPGRIHHAMRWLGQGRRAFDMMCERAVSRETKGSLLADKQTIQNWIADSWAEMQAARLMTLHAAWVMDHKGSSGARKEIAAIKFFGAKVLHDVIDRAVQIHGALGVSTDLPLERMYRYARAARIVDGPDEVHRVTVAKRVLRDYKPHEGLWPREHIPTRRAAALEKFAALLEEVGANL